MEIALAAEHFRHLTAFKHPKYIARLIEGLGALMAILAFLLTANTIYPLQRFQPLARVGGTHVGGSNYQEALAKLQAARLDTTRLDLKIGAANISPTYTDLGVSFDLPYSVIGALSSGQIDRQHDSFAIIKSDNFKLKYKIDDAKLEAYLNKALQAYRAAPRNASLSVVDGEIIERRELAGLRVDNELIKSAILSAAESGRHQINLNLETIEPAIKTTDLGPAITATQQLLVRQPVLHYQDKVFAVDRATYSGWITYEVNEAAKAIKPRLDEARIGTYLEFIAKEINYAPKPVYRTLRDHGVAAQTAGSPGLEVDISTTATEVIAAISRNEDIVGVTTKVVEPPVIDSYTYSPTSEGIALLIADFVATHGGTYGVQFSTLDGAISAGHQPNRSFVTASTFKMFLAYAVLKKVEMGELALSDTTNIGWSVDACIYEMIHYSTNFCAVALEHKIGWVEAQNLVAAAGFSQTNINNYDANYNYIGDKHSTAADEADFLRRLNAGQLLGAGFTNKLLTLFKGQVYRAGLPSGVPRSVAVADKVGFLEGYLHDVGVVYAPRPYVLVIMTYGGNWGAFAELNRQIYNVLHQ